MKYVALTESSNAIRVSYLAEVRDMFALMIIGSILLVAVLFAVVRRSREAKIECGPLHPCLGDSKRREKSAAA